MSTLPVEVIVIAPAWIPVRVPGAAVRTFTTIDAFDAWRAGKRRATPLAPHVTAVLRELGFSHPPPLLEPLLSWLSEQANTPPVKALARRWSSRRSFFRQWALPIPPAAFLARVRSAHARCLLGAGHTAPEAARLAGYSSVTRLHRDLVPLASPTSGSR